MTIQNVYSFVSGGVFVSLVKWGWDRFWSKKDAQETRNLEREDKVADRKDMIGRRFLVLYQAAKGHGFRFTPKNQKEFVSLIIDIEKYDELLSNKLAQCRFRWGNAVMERENN